jgi:hypothetical protein
MTHQAQPHLFGRPIERFAGFSLKQVTVARLKLVLRQTGDGQTKASAIDRSSFFHDE